MPAYQSGNIKLFNYFFKFCRKVFIKITIERFGAYRWGVSYNKAPAIAVSEIFQGFQQIFLALVTETFI